MNRSWLFAIHGRGLEAALTVNNKLRDRGGGIIRHRSEKASRAIDFQIDGSSTNQRWFRISIAYYVILSGVFVYAWG